MASPSPEDSSLAIQKLLEKGLTLEQRWERWKALTRDQKWEFHSRLPEDLEDLKDALWSADTADTNDELGKKYGLSEEQVSQFAELEGCVLLGVLPPEQFKQGLEKILGLEPEVAEALFQDVEGLIFGPVQESLQRLYGEEERKTGEPLKKESAETTESEGRELLWQAQGLNIKALDSVDDGRPTEQIDRDILAQINAALEAGLTAEDEALARFTRGSVYLRQDRPSDAEMEITGALELDPRLINSLLLWSAWEKLSRIAEQRGDIQRAVECLRSAIADLEKFYDAAEDAGAFALAYCELSLLHLQHRRELESADELAQRYAQKALEFHPDCPDAHLALALLYEAREPMTAEDRELAIAYYEKYLRLIGTPTCERDKSGVQVARDSLASLRKETTHETAKGGCFVATAVYGGVDHPDVRLLRAFRDEVLSSSAPGRALVRLYYAISPILVSLARIRGVKILLALLIVRPALLFARSRPRKAVF